VALEKVPIDDSSADAEAQEKTCNYVAVAVDMPGSDILGRDSLGAGMDSKTDNYEAADVGLEVAGMRPDTAVGEAADIDSVMELAKGNGLALAAGYIKAQSTPFGKTSRSSCQMEEELMKR